MNEPTSGDPPDDDDERETVEAISGTIDRLVNDHCTKAVREQADGGGLPNALWEAVEAVGLTRAWLAESEGGAGLSIRSVMQAVRRLAYHAAPVPLAETLVAGRLLAAAGVDVPDGALSFAVAVIGDGKAGAAPTRVTATAVNVPWGAACRRVVLLLDADEMGGVVLLDTSDARASVNRTLAGEPRADLAFVDAVPLAAGRLDHACGNGRLLGALVRSVQMAGALEGALDQSIRYARERVQFGRPIARFQAVQHMLAVFAGHTAAAGAAVDLALEASAFALSPLAIAIAKARTGEAAGIGTEIAHQVLGAMGFTREHTLHYLTRRLWSWRDEFGNELAWQREIGRQVLADGADRLWPTLTELGATAFASAAGDAGR